MELIEKLRATDANGVSELEHLVYAGRLSDVPPEVLAPALIGPYLNQIVVFHQLHAISIEAGLYWYHDIRELVEQLTGPDFDDIRQSFTTLGGPDWAPLQKRDAAWLKELAKRYARANLPSR